MTDAKSASTSTKGIDPALPQKKRARRRLIGALTFLAGAALLFSLVFDHEPKPSTPELALKIPPKDKSAVEPDPKAPEVKAADSKVEAKAPAAKPDPAPVAVVPAVPSAVTTETAKPADKITEKSAEKKAAVVASADPIERLTREQTAKQKPSDTVEKASAGFMVQIGAFSSQEKLQAALDRAQAAGFKTKTEKIDTPKGERTRVRIGPFPDRATANSAREKLKAQGLEPALIAL
jgi:DedD protein